MRPADFARQTVYQGAGWLLVVLVHSGYPVGCAVCGWSGQCTNGVYNAFCILVLFPIVVSMGAGSRITDPKSARICTWLGELSYPLYITHYPLMYMQMSWAWAHPDAPLYAHIMVAAGVFVLSILLAWGCLKLYDVPVRDWLKRHWLMKQK